MINFGTKLERKKLSVLEIFFIILLFYTNSYFVDPFDKSIISSTANYVDFEYFFKVFLCHVFAFNFILNKSGKAGLKIYNNFLKHYVN